MITTISISLEEEELKKIDDTANKENRNRSNFFLHYALKRVKEVEEVKEVKE